MRGRFGVSDFASNPKHPKDFGVTSDAIADTGLPIAVLELRALRRRYNDRPI